MNTPHLFSVTATCGIIDRNLYLYNYDEMQIIYLSLQRKGLAESRSAVKQANFSRSFKIPKLHTRKQSHLQGQLEKRQKQIQQGFAVKD